ncbi:NUDIX domain-containing protein [Nonomuraea sp. NPDC059007]|uniref:NUDIX domain-containing protein n=1 Tax=Nonomuraea sp. NPDC059007 TaxID=3346692 RepID=UPI0036BB83B4
MRWQVHSEEPLYTDPWLDVRVADVELPDGRHLDHRLIRTAPGAGAAVTDDQGRVLLIWRHRFITDSWGWEIPIGKVEEGEEPIAAAAREVEEETGWRPHSLRPLLSVQPTNGISDSVHHIFRADSATYIGPPTEGWEAERIEWVALADVRRLIGKGDVVSGTSMAALLYLLTNG